MKRFWGLVKRKKITSALIAAAIIILAFVLASSRNVKPNYNTTTAKRGTVVQEVSVSGRVKAAQSVDLAFEKVGRVSRINVKIGDKVRTGQTLVSLTNDDVYAQLLQAEAGVESSQAKLDEMKKGARPEEIQITKTDLEKARQDLNNYYSGMINVMNDAYTKADDAVRKQTDQMFSNDETDYPTLTYSSSNTQAQTDSQYQRVNSRDTLNSWKIELALIQGSSDREILSNAIINVKKHLNAIKNFLTNLAATLEGATNLSPTTLDSYKYNANLGRTNINTATTNIGNQEQLINSQILVAKKFQDQLNLQLAGYTAEQINAQEALVKQAQANLKNYQAQLDKTVLRAPFSGIITKQNSEVGQIVSQNSPIISIISEAKFEIETNIPEVDITKVKIGNIASITFDAYGSDMIFEATVATIEPAETIIEGVATYKTTLQLNSENQMIKPGMTANIDILTDKRENIIFIPQRAVRSNGEKTTRIIEANGKAKEIIIETGLRGSDGNIEITKGINEGDIVVISEK